MATQATINLSSVSGDQAIYTATAATSRTDVLDYFFIVSGAGTIIIKDAGGTEYGRYTITAAGQQVSRPSIGEGCKRFTAVGNLVLNLSGSLTVTGDFTYSIQS